MTYDAVIFDLFGTLVPQFTKETYYDALTDMADVLGVDGPSFATAWLRGGGEGDQRICGLTPFEDEVISACGLLGCTTDAQSVQLAWGAYEEAVRRSLTPREDAIPTLSYLKSRGYKIGLVSDCSWEMPHLWSSTPFASWFDARVFSCEQGMRKPNPRMYRLAAKMLGVEPERCLYIGDGGCSELNGASAVGMRPVLICVPEDRAIIQRRTEPNGWRGLVVERLGDIRAFLQET